MRCFKIVITVLLTAALAMSSLAAVSVLGADHAGTLNLLNVRKNESGAGFNWANRTDTLTLTNFTLDTSERYGLRVPDGATIVIEGSCSIRASYAALDIEGDAYIRGTGTLYLESGDIGLLNPINMDGKKIVILEGNIHIKASGTGISSPYAAFCQNGGTVKVNAGKSAIEARTVKLMGGSFTADAGVHAANELTCAYMKLDISSADSALASDKKLSLRGMTFVLPDGKKTDEYSGQPVITTQVKSKARTTSLLYGDKMPIALDYLTGAAALLIVAAVIILPRIRKKKRLKEAISRYEAEQKLKKTEEKNTR